LRQLGLLTDEEEAAMCPWCKDPKATVIRKGYFDKASTRAEKIQRFHCKGCHRRFSTQTDSLTYREKKPHLDQPLFRLLCSGMSQRACARLLGCHPKTVARKLCRLGLRAKERLAEWRAEGPVGGTVVFDEMETFEHTKCKPLSIALAVEEGSRRVVAVVVASMPAKGKLAAVARKRYGPRRDGRRKALEIMAKAIDKASPRLTLLKSDQCPRYPSLVARLLPRAMHETYLSRRGCVVGQGELKRGGFDPLFSLNHTAAMFRDRLKRLSRRTWCTTKRPDRLQLLLDLYAWYHNELLAGAGRLVSV
jgi:transposase-like protein